MTISNTDKLNEALVLLEFTQDITIAWDIDAVQLGDDALYGLTYLIRQISDLLKEACKKEEEK